MSDKFKNLSTLPIEGNALLDLFPFPVSACDAAGVINYLNCSAQVQWADYGGLDLLGKNLPDCHNTASQQILQRLLVTHSPNIYTVIKDNQRKMVFQLPLGTQTDFAGLLEMVIPVPDNIPVKNRDISPDDPSPDSSRISAVRQELTGVIGALDEGQAAILLEIARQLQGSGSAAPNNDKNPQASEWNNLSAEQIDEMLDL